jgi:DNA-binding NtrC family response regulator
MEKKDKKKPIVAGPESFPAKPDATFQSGPAATKTMKNTAAALVSAYLAANLNFRDIPLKRFLDDCEKKILLDCLHETGGRQKNAAAMLGILPTSLCEKMRKHGIQGRRVKLAEKLRVALPEE